MSVIKIAVLWIWGGALYFLCELLWRGHSHPSMFVVGGICFVFVGVISRVLRDKTSFLTHTLLGTAAITAVELIAGLIINKSMGLGVWDYSHMPLNLWGQICPQYTAAWLPLTAIGIAINGLLRRNLFGERETFGDKYRFMITLPKFPVLNLRTRIISHGNRKL